MHGRGERWSRIPESVPEMRPSRRFKLIRIHSDAIIDNKIYFYTIFRLLIELRNWRRGFVRTGAKQSRCWLLFVPHPVFFRVRPLRKRLTCEYLRSQYHYLNHGLYI
jgi:hypothetical protein